jgi:hypothetical protein
MKCPMRFARCLRCFQVGHKVGKCRIQKASDPPDLICFSCYLPFGHSITIPGQGIVKFPMIKAGRHGDGNACSELVLRLILMVGIFQFKRFDADVGKFHAWYLNPNTNWIERFQYIMNLAGRFPISHT